MTVTPTQPVTRPIGRLAVFVCLLCWSVAGLAKSYSDLFVIVDTDGLSYTAQLTVFTDEEMVVSQVPTSRENLETVFAGPRSAVYQRAHEKNPDKLTVISGSVLTRFRHRFDSPDTSADESVAPLVRATLDEFSTTMANSRSLMYRVSWVLPPNLELIDYGADNQRTETPDISWSRRDDNLLIFEQRGTAPTRLWLEYRVHASASKEDACLATLGPSEWCSPDSDNDGVPDYRDVCIASQSTDTDATRDASAASSVLADEGHSELMIGAMVTAASQDSLGCENRNPLVLRQIQFESGQTYLNVTARALLDTLAVALQRMPEKRFRIVSHTDNIGPSRNNQQLSDNRASAIRHYLMLRGVSPNQVQAVGSGESQPAHDNDTAAGRSANRRVELLWLNP